MGSKDLSTLVKAIALAFLFNVPAVAFSADTYGVNASKEDVKLTDTNLIENVTYGAWVDKGHQAEINSNGLTISARKAVAYIKSGKWGGGTFSPLVSSDKLKNIRAGTALAVQIYEAVDFSS